MNLLDGDCFDDFDGMKHILLDGLDVCEVDEDYDIEYMLKVVPVFYIYLNLIDVHDSQFQTIDREMLD